MKTPAMQARLVKKGGSLRGKLTARQAASRFAAARSHGVRYHKKVMPLQRAAWPRRISLL